MCGLDDGEGDYLNCPMSAAEYRAFYAALTSAESATVHDFDREKFFEGCLPIEVMAHRGEDTLRFGPMKPVGLTDPRTGPPAVRGRSAAAGQSCRRSLQPRRVPDAVEVGRAGARAAADSRARAGGVRALRHGSPQHLHQRSRPCCTRRGRRRANPALFFAGQISGVEGYVESAASGLIAGRNAAALSRGERLRVPPRTTAIGALAYYVSHADPRDYQPTNITFGIIEPPAPIVRDKMKRKLAISERALKDLADGTSSRNGQGRGEGWGRTVRQRAHEAAPQRVSRVPAPQSQRLAPHGHGVCKRSRPVPAVCRAHAGHAARCAEAGRHRRVGHSRVSRRAPSPSHFRVVFRRASCRRCARSSGI